MTEKSILIVFLLLITACVRIPENIEPVNNFSLQRYLGEWYEIARLDHSFERGLSHVSASYSLRGDGGINVINRGYSEEDQSWQQAEGKAYFVEDSDLGWLKVSFFGPFYSSYIVFELDHDNYSYSLVTGPDKSYFWLLARRPQIGASTQARLIKKAAALGFDTDKLIFVEHNNINE